MGRSEGILDCRVRVTEKSGTPIGRMFSLTNLWDGTPCGRKECAPCNQGGEVVYPCLKRNLTYENICLICKPGAEGKKAVHSQDRTALPSIYVGETCRSLAERSGEHWKNFENGDLESHILKHHVIHHGGQGEPKFHIRPVRFHRTALNRQVSEAVRIGTRGPWALNSKSEWNRCEIPRLSLQMDNLTNKDYGEDSTSQEE